MFFGTNWRWLKKRREKFSSQTMRTSNPLEIPNLALHLLFSWAWFAFIVHFHP